MQAIVSNVDVVFLLLLHHVGKIPPAGSLKLNLGPIGGYVQAVPCTGWKTTERENSSSVLLLLIHVWPIHVSFRLYRVALVCGEIWHVQAGAGSLLKRFETYHICSPLSNLFIRHFSHFFCNFRFDTFSSSNLTQVWGPASFGLLPPARTTFSSSPTIRPQTTHASSKFPSSNGSRSTSNLHNSTISLIRSDQLGQSNGESIKNLELTNINPSNTYSVNLSSGNCSKELTANVSSSTERKSWQTALLQSVTQQGEKPQ